MNVYPVTIGRDDCWVIAIHTVRANATAHVDALLASDDYDASYATAYEVELDRIYDRGDGRTIHGRWHED